jgi:hypothetical protein
MTQSSGGDHVVASGATSSTLSGLGDGMTAVEVGGNAPLRVFEAKKADGGENVEENGANMRVVLPDES